jgi:hypothetical protein
MERSELEVAKEEIVAVKAKLTGLRRQDCRLIIYTTSTFSLIFCILLYNILNVID